MGTEPKADGPAARGFGFALGVRGALHGIRARRSVGPNSCALAAGDEQTHDVGIVWRLAPYACPAATAGLFGFWSFCGGE